jgi:hypothetical protein
MLKLDKNCITFLQARFPSAPVVSKETTFSSIQSGESFAVYAVIAIDPTSGIKHRAIAFPNLGTRDEIIAVLDVFDKIFNELSGALSVRIGNSLKGTYHDISTEQMAFSARLSVYTNRFRNESAWRREVHSLFYVERV